MATVYAGETLVTSVSVTKTNGEIVVNPTISYTSSDPSVATVDSIGRVYTHVAGKATIFAAVGPVRDSLRVTVAWAPVTHVFFGADSLIVFVGDTIAPDLTVLNSHGNHANYATLTYASSDPDIAAMVDTEVRYGYEEGKIVAVGEGRTTIKVVCERISDVLTVIVKSSSTEAH